MILNFFKTVLRPRWKMERTGFMPSELAYDPKSVIIAWKSMLKAAFKNGDNDVFRHDLVDITRQVISDAFLVAHREIMSLYESESVSFKEVRDKGDAMLEMILDMDRILATSKNFLLGTWLYDAIAMGNTTEEMQYFEYEARNQITRWGEHNSNVLGDYAGKQWSGFVKWYYYRRWEIFLTELCESKRNTRKFNHAHVSHVTEKFEVNWQHEHVMYSNKTRGDTIHVSHQLYHKYGNFKIHNKKTTKKVWSINYINSKILAFRY